MLIDVHNHTSFAFPTKKWLKQTSQFTLSEWNIAWLHPQGEKKKIMKQHKNCKVVGYCSLRQFCFFFSGKRSSRMLIFKPKLFHIKEQGLAWIS